MSFTSRIKSYTRWKWKIFRITFLSLFYNEHFSSDYAFDTLMQPAFWFVDQFTAVLGPAFVSLVIVLTVGINENFSLDNNISLPSDFRCIHRLLDWSPLLLGIQKYLSTLG